MYLYDTCDIKLYIYIWLEILSQETGRKPNLPRHRASRARIRARCAAICAPMRQHHAWPVSLFLHVGNDAIYATAAIERERESHATIVVSIFTIF
jgi:hypothetical protein